MAQGNTIDNTKCSVLTKESLEEAKMNYGII